MMDHNDKQEDIFGKWAITPSTVSRLTGSNRDLIRAYFADNAERINAHHEKHAITEKHNYWHGRHKHKIEDAIDVSLHPPTDGGTPL